MEDTPPERHHTTHPPRSRLVLIASILIALAIAAYTALSTIAIRQSTGILTINAFADDARISVRKLGTDTKTIGKGTTKARLEPGTYQITASTGQGGTSKIVQIFRQSSAVLSMDGEEFVPIQRIANYNAQDIFATADNQLYFLDKQAGIPYMYPLGDDAARPYNGNLSDVRSMQWLGPARVVTESSDGDWSYTTNMSTKSIQYKGRAPLMLALNQRGNVAGIGADNTVLQAKSITSPLQSIGTVRYSTAKASIAPDGTIIVYTPQANPNYPTEASRLFRGGQSTTLPSDLTGISNIAWSPDSSSFSYTTSAGFFVYNTSTRQHTQITAGIPTDPRSALWLNPRQILYAEENGIWRYDIPKKVSIQMGTLQGNLGVHAPFSLAPDGVTVYFSTSVRGKDQNGSIYSLVSTYRQLPESERKAMTERLQKNAQNPVTYLGINTFIDNGLTPDQTQSIEYALGQFPETSKRGIEAIRFYDFHIQLTPDPIDSMTFKVDVNGVYRYNGKIDVRDISSVRLFLNDQKTNKPVYDSGAINTQ